jgi:purine-nucleoside phosphorylase
MVTATMEQLNETVNYIKNAYNGKPEVGIILGSGLGSLVDDIIVEIAFNYEDIPHYPVSTVAGHSGRLIFGELNGKKVVVMAGRFHYYEGYMARHIAYPVRVMKLLGVNTLFISNAAGSVNSDFNVGDLMIINDHISFFVPNPLIGTNEDELGPRFPDMSEPYSKVYIAKAKQIAEQHGFGIKEGVYTAVTGPTFETRAEYRLIKAIGGDAVGMSTVQEVITAAHAGMTVFAISVITDIGIREDDNIITHEEVLAAAKEAGPKLTTLFKEMLAVI